jgi:hypothetical protein
MSAMPLSPVTPSPRSAHTEAIRARLCNHIGGSRRREGGTGRRGAGERLVYVILLHEFEIRAVLAERQRARGTQRMHGLTRGRTAQAARLSPRPNLYARANARGGRQVQTQAEGRGRPRREGEGAVFVSVRMRESVRV